MNSQRIKDLRNQISAADRLNFLAYVLENGKTAADGLGKLSVPVQDMLIAAALVFSEARNISHGHVIRPTNLRAMRVERRMSLEQLAQLIHTRTATVFDLNRLAQLEERPPSRDKCSLPIVIAIEEIFGRGWEHLSARVDAPQP
jgi:hypothetical protein